MRISDWSSDVCSSDLARNPKLLSRPLDVAGVHPEGLAHQLHLQLLSRGGQVGNRRPVRAIGLAEVEMRSLDPAAIRDRKSEVSGTSVSVRVDLGGSRTLKKQHKQIFCTTRHT